jgi:hypothetical protein
MRLRSSEKTFRRSFHTFATRRKPAANFLMLSHLGENILQKFSCFRNLAKTSRKSFHAFAPWRKRAAKVFLKAHAGDKHKLTYLQKRALAININ